VKKESGAPTKRKSTARVKKVVRPREAKAQQSSTRSGKLEGAARKGGSRKEVKEPSKY